MESPSIMFDSRCEPDAVWVDQAGTTASIRMQTRVGRGDDRADGLLVEALVALAPFQVFEVAADRPFTEELLVLLRR